MILFVLVMSFRKLFKALKKINNNNNNDDEKKKFHVIHQINEITESRGCMQI